MKSSTHKNNHNSNRLHLWIPIVDLVHVVCYCVCGVRRASGIRHQFSLLNILHRRSYLSKTFQKREKEQQKNNNLTGETHLFLMFLSSLLLSNWVNGLVMAFSMIFYAIDTILIDICIIKRSIHIRYFHRMDVINEMNDIFSTCLKWNYPKTTYYSYQRIDIESGFLVGFEPIVSIIINIMMMKLYHSFLNRVRFRFIFSWNTEILVFISTGIYYHHRRWWW